jgi:hypothetical protein
MNIPNLARTHLVDRGEIVTDITFTIYSIVFGIAWWMIVRGKPALRRWVIAANLILIFTFVPALLTKDWRGVLKLERDWWPVILIGIFGMIIFSIPYHGWRHKSQFTAKRRSEFQESI